MSILSEKIARFCVEQPLVNMIYIALYWLDVYDRLHIGYSIWWYVAPTIINTFLESYDFSGKTIILFATSGGRGFGRTADSLKRSVSEDTVIKEGKLLNGYIDKAVLSDWVNEFNK